MEKKTIGKFISALRRAHGMTQKELGEKLFVSDKTVSRWERDECDPELSLIPVIAEIFGITADELLRGERKNPDAVLSDAQKGRGEKQVNTLLHRQMRKYGNLTLISAGLTLVGLIVAVVCNNGFNRALLAFCFALAFCLAAEICQLCFVRNATVEADDGEYRNNILAHNTKVAENAVKFTFFNLAVLGFCLPLLSVNNSYYGLSGDVWIGYGALSAAAVIIAAYLLYILFIRNIFAEMGVLVYGEDKKANIKRDRKRLIIISTACGCVIAALGITLLIVESVGWKGFSEKHEFYTLEDFKQFMEDEYDRWYEEYSMLGEVDKDAVFDGVYYPKCVIEQVLSDDGEVLCEYYFNPDLVAYLHFSSQTLDKTPVTVYTSADYYTSYYDYYIVVRNLCLVGMLLTVAIGFAVYIFSKKPFHTRKK